MLHIVLDSDMKSSPTVHDKLNICHEGAAIATRTIKLREKKSSHSFCHYTESHTSRKAKMAFGDYPAEYNRAKHGPYDPSRFYGKRKYKIIRKAIQKHSSHIIGKSVCM